MSQLKMKTKTYYEVDYNDLEEFIRTVTGHDYEIVCNEESSNDSSKTYSVTGFKSDYEKQYKLPNWVEFKNTGRNKIFMLGTILNGLAEDGHIPMGEYIVDICW